MSVKPYVLFTSPKYDKRDKSLDVYYKTFPTTLARFAIKLEPVKFSPESAITKSRIKDSLKRQSELIACLSKINPRLLARLEYIKMQKKQNQVGVSLDILFMLEAEIVTYFDEKPLNQKEKADLINKIYFNLAGWLERLLPEYRLKPVVSKKEYLSYYGPFVYLKSEIHFSF